MRALYLTLAACAGIVSIALLAVVQLIWAGSEAAYYAQIFAGLLLLAVLFVAARRARQPVLAVAVFAFAALAALMPIDLTLAVLGRFADNGAMSPKAGDVIEGSRGIAAYLLDLAKLWLVHAVLLTTFAFGIRRAARRGDS